MEGCSVGTSWGSTLRFDSAERATTHVALVGRNGLLSMAFHRVSSI